MQVDPEFLSLLVTYCAALIVFIFLYSDLE